MIRYLVTFLVVTALTSAASLWWLHDRDLVDAVAPVLPEWDAAALAKRAGVASDPVPATLVAPDPGAAELE